MKPTLASKNKMTFINGSLPQNFELWNHCNNIMHSWITRTLSPHIEQSDIPVLTQLQISRQIWKTDLQNEITLGFSITQRSPLHIKKWMFFIKILYLLSQDYLGELEFLRTTPSCICRCARILNSSIQR